MMALRSAMDVIAAKQRLWGMWEAAVEAVIRGSAMAAAMAAAVGAVLGIYMAERSTGERKTMSRSWRLPQVCVGTQQRLHDSW